MGERSIEPSSAASFIIISRKNTHEENENGEESKLQGSHSLSPTKVEKDSFHEVS